MVTEIQNDLEIICCDDHFQVDGVVSDVLCPGDGNGGIDLSTVNNFAPYNYIWSNGANSEDLTGVEPGEYTVTISDQATCETVRSFTVGGPPAFTFDTIITMPTCDGGTDGTLTLQVAGGTPGYEYSFGGGPFQASNTLTDISIGNYNVVVRDANGCESIQDIEVNELVLELDPLVASIQEPRCNGESNGRISVNIDNGQGPYEYDFNLGSGLKVLPF